MTRALLLLVLVGCSPTPDEHARLSKQRDDFEAKAGVKRIDCVVWGGSWFAMRTECAGTLEGRAVRYVCYLDSLCTWIGDRE